MEDLFGVIVFIIICTVIFVNQKSKKSASKKVSTPRAVIKSSSTNTKYVAKPVSNTPTKVANNKILAAEVNHNMLADDRTNDWLARQLRDEHLAFKQTKDMFDLKIEHASHCDAKYIRDFHHRECDAQRIDTASGK